MSEHDAYSREHAQNCRIIALNQYGDRWRRGGLAVQHALRVGDALWDDWECYRLASVGYLHDVLEDIPDLTSAELARLGVSSVVIADVEVLTKARDTDYADYIAAVIDRGARCVAVKIADIVDNLTDDPGPKQIIKYRKALQRLAGSP